MPGGPEPTQEDKAGLDIEQHDDLLRYLRESGHISPDEQPVMRTLAGGVSNRTVLVERPGREALVLKQALAKLRVPDEWLCSPERIHREALGLRWLIRLAPEGSITKLLFEDHTCHLIAMEAVPEPHENWKTMLLAGRLKREHVKRFGELLRAIHQRGLENKQELATVFGDRTFFEALRLEPYYQSAAARVPEASPFLARLVEETRRRRDTLVHGDYSPKNVLLRDDHLVLVDHEVIHFGDPAFDLGFSLAHLLSKAHHLSRMRSDFADAALLYWGSYDGSADIEPRAVRHALGCLLARVAGRSPLEYLDDGERDRQQRVVVSLMQRPPVGVGELVERFVEAV